MKKILLFSCVIAFTMLAKAQQTDIAQWKQQIENNTPEKLTAYANWTNHLSISNFDSCIVAIIAEMH